MDVVFGWFVSAYADRAGSTLTIDVDDGDRREFPVDRDTATLAAVILPAGYRIKMVRFSRWVAYVPSPRTERELGCGVVINPNLIRGVA